MLAILKQVIENIEELTSDESVDNAWAELAEKRFSELESGVVEGVPWSEISYQAIVELSNTLPKFKRTKKRAFG